MEKRMCRFCGRDGLARTMDFYPGGVYGACRNVEACEKRRKAGDRKADLEEARQERERIRRIHDSSLEYATRHGLDPYADPYRLDSKLHRQFAAALRNPAFSNLLWTAWVNHRIHMDPTWRNMDRTRDARLHHCAPDPCFRNIIRTALAVLNGRIRPDDD